LKEKARLDKEEKEMQESWLKERNEILNAILQESVDQDMDFSRPDLEVRALIINAVDTMFTKDFTSRLQL
jgi:hypothetical protein